MGMGTEHGVGLQSLSREKKPNVADLTLCSTCHHLDLLLIEGNLSPPPSPPSATRCQAYLMARWSVSISAGVESVPQCARRVMYFIRNSHPGHQPIFAPRTEWTGRSQNSSPTAARWRRHLVLDNARKGGRHGIATAWHVRRECSAIQLPCVSSALREHFQTALVQGLVPLVLQGPALPAWEQGGRESVGRGRTDRGGEREGGREGED